MWIEMMKFVAKDIAVPCIVAIITVLITGKIEKRMERAKQIPRMYSIAIRNEKQLEQNKQSLCDCKKIIQIYYKNHTVDDILRTENNVDIRFREITYKDVEEYCKNRDLIVIGFDNNIGSGIVLNKISTRESQCDIDSDVVTQIVKSHKDYCFVCDRNISSITIQGISMQIPVCYMIKFQTQQIYAQVKKKRG